VSAEILNKHLMAFELTKKQIKSIIKEKNSLPKIDEYDYKELTQFIKTIILSNEEFINLKVFQKTKVEFITLLDYKSTTDLDNKIILDTKIVEKIMENNLLYKMLTELKDK